MEHWGILLVIEHGLIRLFFLIIKAVKTLSILLNYISILPPHQTLPSNPLSQEVPIITYYQTVHQGAKVLNAPISFSLCFYIVIDVIMSLLI